MLVKAYTGGISSSCGGVSAGETMVRLMGEKSGFLGGIDKEGVPGLQKLGQPESSNIKRVIAVMSGKGGVGKSSVTALIASELSRRSRTTGILDADVTGPSIPKLFGLRGGPAVLESKLLPETSDSGIRAMSLNLLLEHEDDPVICRGPFIAGAVKQFWTDVLWGDIDYMLMDLPPGTGDAPLTVLQSIPVDGIVIVSTPQELSVMVVQKAVNMALNLKVPVIGLVMNMGWLTCPKCGARIEPFGPVKAEETAKELGLDLLGSLPIDPELSALGDMGRIEDYWQAAAANIVDKWRRQSRCLSA
jgi:Mrp family chromosome partitioning ATPase